MDGVSADPQQRSKQKCGPLLNRLVSQFSMENNQHPKTVASATEALSNHAHDRRACQGNHKQKKSWCNSSKRGDN